MSAPHDKDAAARAAEVINLFRKGADFTRELVEENQRLRGSLAEVESRQQEAAQSPVAWDKLRVELTERIKTLEEDRNETQERLQSVEAENQQFLSRYLEVEEENNNLANLYISSFQLHASLSLGETLKTILEIVINLVGAERFAVFVQDEKAQRLEAVASEGGKLHEFPPAALGEGAVGGCLERGEVVYPVPLEQADGSAPIVSIPLCVQDQKVGVIAIYTLLQQKTGFAPLDHELFSLLAGHAATAILAARLHAQSERKLSTIQGFIELLSR